MSPCWAPWWVGSVGNECLAISMASQQKTTPMDRGHKRTRPDSDSDTDCDIVGDHSWPHFLVLQGTDDNFPLGKLSPFAIAKGLEGLAGVPKNVRKLRDGQVLVEVDKKCYSDNLLRSTMLAGCPIQVSPHKSLNTVKGVMRCSDLRDTPLEEIQEGLESQLVTDVKRIYVTRDGSKKPTNTFILTFSLVKLPKEVRIGYLNVPLEVYVPNPLRCFKCQQFGHHKERCQRPAVCAKCGGKDHDEADCGKQLHCANCQGSHAAFSKDCPKWQQEKEVQRLKHTLGISFYEARKRVVPEQKTYAAVAKESQKVSTKSASVQTDLTWPLTSQNPKKVETSAVPTNQINASCQTPRNDSSKEAKKAPKSQSQTHRSRSLTKDPPKVREPSKSSGHKEDQEEEMDTELFPKERPCPLSKKKDRGGGKHTAPK